MKREDAVRIFKRLAASYPNWKVDKDIAEVWVEELQNADPEHAWMNAKDHIRESRFAPTIAEIVKPHPEIEAKREKERTRKYIDEQEEREKAKAADPPWVKEGIDKMTWLKKQIQANREKRP